MTITIRGREDQLSVEGLERLRAAFPDATIILDLIKPPPEPDHVLRIARAFA